MSYHNITYYLKRGKKMKFMKKIKKKKSHPEHSSWLDRNHKKLLYILGLCLLLLVIVAMTSINFLISDIRLALIFMILILIISIAFYVLFPY